MTLRIGSLFSGYGGLDMAVAAHYGATVAWHVEFDKHPSAILAHHHPDIPNHGDITAVDWSRVEPVDIITGGFPCQDVSHAGLRRGVHRGTRSGLWFEMARAIDALQPRKVVIENVAGLLSADAAGDVEPCPWCVGDEPAGHMRALGAVLADLAEMGFDADWGSVRAADAGAPHGRLRVFIVGTATYPGGETVGQRPGLRESEPGRLGWGRPDDGDPQASDVTLLPTPTAQDFRDGKHLRQITRDAAERGSSRGVGLNHLMEGDLPAGGAPLLPTPAVNDMGRGKTPQDWDEWTDAMRARHGNGNGHGKSLEIEAQRLLPTPTSRDHKGRNQRDDATCLPGAVVDFGPYAAAIARWGQVLGRPAPPPTEPGTNGRPKLSAHFVEWLMGLPDGWVTGVGIPRSAQLKALGNGVVPQQAALALAMLDGDGAAVPPKTVKGLR